MSVYRPYLARGAAVAAIVRSNQHVGKPPAIRIISAQHLRPPHAPPFRSALEAHAYQHRRRLGTGYGQAFDFTFKAGDVAASALMLPSGPNPFGGSPEAFARAADVAAARLSWPNAMIALMLLGDVDAGTDAASAMLKVRGFAEQHLLPLGLGIDAVMHEPMMVGRPAARHAHCIISCRTQEPHGFGRFIKAAAQLFDLGRMEACLGNATVAV